MTLEQQEPIATASIPIKRNEIITELAGGVFLVGGVLCGNPQAARAALRASFPSLFPPGPTPGVKRKRAKKTAPTADATATATLDDQDRR